MKRVKQPKNKEWEVDVDIRFSQLVSAPTKAKAISQVKDSFYDEYNLDIDDSEIVEVREVK
jgi:hypothetical protein